MKDSFDEERWTGLSARIAEAFRMSEKEAAAFAANRTARLVAAIPFAAGCEEAERTALEHLSTFVLASTPSCRHVFDHKAADDRDPLARLAPIADFRGGDPAVIDRGMRLLAIIMISGYRRDLDKDRKSGEYNPLLSAAWNADKTIEGLVAGLADGSALPFGYMTPETAKVTFWNEP